MELAGNAGVALSRDWLLQRVWGFDFNGDERTIDVHVHRLRAKIEEPWQLPVLSAHRSWIRLQVRARLMLAPSRISSRAPCSRRSGTSCARRLPRSAATSRPCSRSDCDPATARRFLETARRETLRLGRLVDGMLEASILASRTLRELQCRRADPRDRSICWPRWPQHGA